MKLKSSDDIIDTFIKEIRIYWQIMFLLGVVLYGISFFYHISSNPGARYLSYFKIIDLISFAMALILAITIFIQKRKYFSLRNIRKMLETLASQNPELDENELARKLIREMKGKMIGVWLLGTALVILGVVFYWWTLVSKNMHIYFIVGIYSLMMNYPRKEFFIDIPYLIRETLKKNVSN